MDLMSYFLGLQNQLQVLHWQTTSYARHMAYGSTYDALVAFVDDFIEMYQGRYGRIKIEAQPAIKNIADDELNGYFSGVITFLSDELPPMLDEKDTDLLNLRDEIIGLFNKLKYLLTLK